MTQQEHLADWHYINCCRFGTTQHNPNKSNPLTKTERNKAKQDLRESKNDMRPTIGFGSNINYSTTSSLKPAQGYNNNNGFRSLKSPIPYLFGGLALMLALIAIALLVLACSYRKRPSSASNDDGDSKTTTSSSSQSHDSQEPKILVIMAGDTNPTYLAKPISSSSSSSSSTHNHHIAQQSLMLPPSS